MTGIVFARSPFMCSVDKHSCICYARTVCTVGLCIYGGVQQANIGNLSASAKFWGFSNLYRGTVHKNDMLQDFTGWHC